MSTKLNAEELAKRDVLKYVHATAYQVAATEGYITAVEKVAQPIADERDELREALEQLLMACADGSNASMYIGTSNARAILAKYRKP
jgi:hypothetical protein